MPRTIQLRVQQINGGLYLTWDGCKRRSTLEGHEGARFHCAAGVGRDVTVRDKHMNEFKLFEGGVLAICEFSGMDQPDEDGKKHVHWGPCESTCSFHENQEQQ